MNEFNNEAYRALVSDLINDAFYLEGTSHRGVIAKIRQYAEVIVRKILNLSPDDTVELGNGKLQHKIKERDNPLLLRAVRDINKIGSECTHTKSIREITEDDVKNTIDRLFELYACILIEYFEKYEFGTNPEIMSSFSILPPIIRYITLNYLYGKYPNNLMIIDKLSLVLLKALNKDAAMTWLRERKDTLEKIHFISPNAHKDTTEGYGEETENQTYDFAPNMYELCSERVELVANNIEKNGQLYNDFESAMPIYLIAGTISGTSSEIKEFNSIMEFLYLGRKPQTEM